MGEADEGHAEHDAEDEARDLAMLVGVGEGVLVGQLMTLICAASRIRRMAAHRATAAPTGNRAVKAKAGGGESTSEKLNRSGEAICPMATAAVASRSDTRESAMPKYMRKSAEATPDSTPVPATKSEPSGDGRPPRGMANVASTVHAAETQKVPLRASRRPAPCSK